MFKTGMFGGSFDPLHMGHINAIIEAASKCETLYVVLSYSLVRDVLPVELRYRWLVGSFRHMPNVKVIKIEDDAPTKEDYTDEYWEKGRDDILAQIGTSIDVVFCGSDYKASRRYEDLYGCHVEYIDRDLFPVSSRAIRENPLLMWNSLPEIARPYYTKRILVVGGESTGKSTLVRNLAMVYGTNYLEEIGREVSWNAVDEDSMNEADFHEILIRHKAAEIEALKHSNRILFEDTDAITTLWYSHFLLKDDKEIHRTEALAESVININRFDLVLFLEPTVPFVQDGTRNEKIKQEREKFSNELKTLFLEHDVMPICLSGSYSDRFEQAKDIINKTFGIREVL